MSRTREPTRRQFVTLLRKALQESGVVQVKLGKAMERDATTISRDLDPTKGKGPPRAGIRRDYERHLGLKPGYLDGELEEDWPEYHRNRRSLALALLGDRQGAGGPQSGPGAATIMIRELLGIYEAKGMLVPPAQVKVWLDMIEQHIKSLEVP